MISRMGEVWGLRSACLPCLLSPAGALWPLNVPEKGERDGFHICCVQEVTVLQGINISAFLSFLSAHTALQFKQN